MAKAENDGRYVLNGHYFRVRKGDILPEGAVMEGDAPQPADEPVEERAQQAAPENKSRKATPEAK